MEVSEEMDKKILTEFEEDLLSDGKADTTIISYVGDIRGFLEWIKTKGIDFMGGKLNRKRSRYRTWYLRRLKLDVNNKNRMIK